LEAQAAAKDTEEVQNGEKEAGVNSTVPIDSEPVIIPAAKKQKVASNDRGKTIPLEKVNGVPSAEKQSVPSKSMPNGTADVTGTAKPKSNTPIRTVSLTNGIKTSPSPSTNAPRSPSVPIISSPAPEIPSPSSIAELRARLAARISQARTARKAVGTSVPGAPKTREAILQARAKRKARVEEKIRAKKEQQKQSTTTDTVKEESSDDEIVESGLKFGRVMVDDAEIDAGKGEIKISKKRKGPSDAKGQLGHLIAREERLAKMDPEKKEKAIENDRWHHALLSARGEKVRDDSTLLKKTIARKEREKKKSKREWEDRLAKVEKSKEDRQRKREENLAKRREEKGKKGKKVVKSKKPLVKKKRPGFEGGRVKFGKK